MAASKQNQDLITFFDLPSRHKGDDKLSCFSYNPWKTRLVLNYKSLPYKTTFVEYPDLAPTLSALGLAPNEPGTAFADYSSPTILLPDGKPVMHSLTIAPALERLYPSPTLHLDTGLHLEAEKHVDAVVGTIGVDALLATQNECLLPRSREHFARTRLEAYGATLEDIAKVKGGEVAWGEAEKEGGCLEGMRTFLNANKGKGEKDGAFVMGKEVAYADFVIVGLFEALRRVHLPSYERLMRFDKSFGELHQACEKWVERDN